MNDRTALWNGGRGPWRALSAKPATRALGVLALGATLAAWPTPAVADDALPPLPAHLQAAPAAKRPAPVTRPRGPIRESELPPLPSSLAPAPIVAPIRVAPTSVPSPAPAPVTEPEPEPIRPATPAPAPVAPASPDLDVAPVAAPVAAPASEPEPIGPAELVPSAAPANEPAPAPAAALDLVAPPVTGAAAPAPAPVAADPSAFKTLDPGVEPAACATCGGGHGGGYGPPFHGLTEGPGYCVPGQKPCYTPFKGDHFLSNFCNNLYQCLCCPDPCYQPRWVPAANASFFADYARPRTITRFRYDNLSNMTFPDRNQFFFSGMPITRENGNPQGRPYLASNPTARLQQIYLYNEIAADRFSFFVEYPYRQVNPEYSPTTAGFSDLNFGTKALLYDCELLQFAFQFRTYTPTGSPSNFLGTGHWSLDPSLLLSLKLGPETYFQAQVGNWIPLAGNTHLNGGILYWFMSFNHVIFEPTPDSPLIATLEMTGWSFQDGGYTRPWFVPGISPIRNSGGGVSYFNIGPGLRWSICDMMDIGGALTFATTELHWADPWFRFEVRFLF